MSVAADAIPLELLELPQWVLWNLESRRGETKATKVPYSPGGSRASSTDASTWSSFEDAQAVAAGFDGLGFVLSEDDDLVGIDLDACGLQADERLHPEAATTLLLLDSYSEWSPSGRGAHIFARGRLSSSRNRTSTTAWGGGFEAYDHARFLTVTGRHIRGCPSTIEPRQAELDELVERMFPPPTTIVPPPTRVSAPIGPNELLERAFSSSSGSAIRALYAGDTSGYGSPSEADLALARHLAFYAGGDPVLIDAVFRTSGLMRDKWERPDYRESTIARAVSSCTDFYGSGTQLTRANGDGRHGRLTLVASVEPKRARWLEEGLIAYGMLTGLVAPGGTVKGLFGIHLAAKLAARGETTLFLCSEDALNHIVRPRFMAAGCDGRLAHALDVEHDGAVSNLRFPSDMPVLEQAVQQVRPTLVIIDPLASHLDPRLDMAKNNEVREVLQPLIALAQASETAIVPVYHLGKTPGRGAIGSVAFEDACRLVLTAARDDEHEDVRHLELTKTNICRSGYGRQLRIVSVPLEIEGETVEVAKLIDEGASSKSVHELLAVKKSPGPEPTLREAARAAIKELLVEVGVAGLPSKEAQRHCAKQAGASLRTVWRAYEELKDEGLAGAEAIRDEYGTVMWWRWFATLKLLHSEG